MANVQTDIKKLTSACSGARKEIKNTFKKFEYKLSKTQLRVNEQKAMHDLIQELDVSKPEAFSLLFAFKMNDINQQINMSQDVMRGFKEGLSDPAKIQKIEKMQKNQKKRKPRDVPL